MKIHIMICDRGFELGISGIPQWLPTISHMIEVTVFYSFLIRVKVPCIHKCNPEMIGMRFSSIEWCPILTRHSLVEKECTRQWHIVHISKENSISWFLFWEKFLRHTIYKSFIRIFYVRIFIDFEKLLEWDIFLYTNDSLLNILEHMTTMGTSLRRPLHPIIFTIEDRKCRTWWVNIPPSQPCRDSEPSFWLLSIVHRSPPDNTMIYTVL